MHLPLTCRVHCNPYSLNTISVSHGLTANTNLKCQSLMLSSREDFIMLNDIHLMLPLFPRALLFTAYQSLFLLVFRHWRWYIYLSTAWLQFILLTGIPNIDTTWLLLSDHHVLHSSMGKHLPLNSFDEFTSLVKWVKSLNSKINTREQIL